MDSVELNTEELILKAAEKLFEEKGFDGTSVQDIALAAGVTKSMVNYYFRSKEKLFSTIFHREYKTLLSGVAMFLASDTSLKDKIANIVALDTDRLTKMPNLPIFVVTEIHRNPEIVFKNLDDLPVVQMFNKLDFLIEKEVKNGTIKAIKGKDLLLNIQSLTIFPFMAKPMLMRLFNMDEQGFNKMLQSRKKEVVDLVWNSIKV